MMEEEMQKLLIKVEKLTKDNKLDLSSDEDLSIGIMNLISIEEHLFFTAQKTGKDSYYTLLNEVRKMRTELMGRMIKEYEGEVWCISKHLLSASMRLMEVGTKQLGQGNSEDAAALFTKSYHLYSLFWALRWNMTTPDTLHEGIEVSVEPAPSRKKHKNMFSKFGELVKKAVNCCKEW